MTTIKYFLFFFLFLLFQQASSQTISEDQLSDETQISETDSTSITSEDKGPSKIRSFFNIFSGKPGRAALYSLVVPGGGQLYNKKYWKVPISWGVEGYYIYRTLLSNQAYRELQSAYLMLKRGEIKDYKGANIEIVRSYRDRARLSKEKYAVYLGLSHLLSVIDAFVDRHLMEFDMSDDLTVDVTQEILTPADIPIDYIALQLTYRF